MIIPLLFMALLLPQGQPAPPGASAGAPPAPATASLTAEEIVPKILQALGGEKAIAQVRALQQVTITTEFPQHPGVALQRHDLNTTFVFPDRFVVEEKTEQGEITMVVSPEVAYTETVNAGARHRQQIGPDEQDAALQALSRNLLNVAQQLRAPDTSVSIVPQGEHPGMVELEISTSDATLHWLVDPATGRVRAMAYLDDETGRPVTLRYSDWRSVGGLNLPFTRDLQRDDRLVAREVDERVVINPPVDPQRWAAPAP